MEESNILEIIQKRQSMRKFDSRSVEKEKILTCLEAARVAPSAENAQPWRFVILNSKDEVENFGLRAFSGVYRQTRWALKAPVLIVLLADLDIIANRIGKMIQGTPYYLLDLGIAGEHIVLQAQALGLGTCWIGWFDEKKAKQSLNIPKRIRMCGILAMGYPEPNMKFRLKKRKSLESIIHWSIWDSV